MKLLAICVPTYERCDIIAELLEKYALKYRNYGFDLYIFDSSEDDLTRQAVHKFREIHGQESNNVFYQHIDSSVHSNLKVYGIFEQFGIEQTYQYVWVCSDSIRWSRRVLEVVSDAMKQGYDLIVPNHRDTEKIGVKQYHNNKNTFFLDCAWHMSLYGATILKCQTMLQDVDWNELKIRYCIPECINHSHVAFYFEKLAQLSEWKAIHLGFERKDLLSSPLKTAPGWVGDAFYVWCHCWPRMINKLPECYDNEKKATVKKVVANDYMFKLDDMVQLRQKNVYNKDVYKKYKKQLKEMTDMRGWLLYIIAYFPKNSVKCLLMFDRKGIRYAKLLKRKINKFCKSYEKIYIYGAGQKARLWSSYCNKMGIDYEGFVVSCVDERTPESIDGHKVVLFNNKLIQDKSGFLLALNTLNVEEVLESINGRNMHYFNEFEEMEPIL